MADFAQLRVVVFGHSYVHWAMKHAVRTGWGRNVSLGAFAMLKWKGKWGMLWPDLLGLALLDFEHAPLNLMVVHLGGNDLTIRKGKSLILQIIN